MKISTATIMTAAALLALLLLVSTTGSMARDLHQTPTTVLSITPAASGAAAASSWATATACKRSPGDTTKVVKDKQGNPWGFEDNVSCAFRDTSGKPVDVVAHHVTGPAGGVRTTLSIPSSKPITGPTVTWATAPRCSFKCPSLGGSAVLDQQGNAWFWEHRGKERFSCAYRDENGKPVPLTCYGDGTTLTWEGREFPCVVRDLSSPSVQKACG